MWAVRAQPQPYVRGQAAVGEAEWPTPAFCVGCAPRRACERRVAAAGWQVALAAGNSRRYGF